MSGIPETFPSEPAQAATGGSEWAPKTTSSVDPPLGTESVTSATDMNPTTAQLVGEKPTHDFAAADPLAPKDSPLPTPGPELPGAFPASQQGEAAGEAGSLGIASAASKVAQSVGSAAAQYLPKSVQPYITSEWRRLSYSTRRQRTCSSR